MKHSYNFIDLTNKRFGRLLVKKYMFTKNKRPYWLCQCDCGNKVIVKGKYLKNNHTKSCGCLQEESRYFNNKKHGLSNDKLYYVYRGMKDRCYCKTNQAYKNYGGRGIKICNEWLKDFKCFYDWAYANGYDDNLTIDRIDVNGNYCPDNCRWVDRKEQQNNTRRNHFITYNGKTYTISEWAATNSKISLDNRKSSDH